MVNTLIDRFSAIARRRIWAEPEEEDGIPSAAEMVEAIERARKDWVTAKSYFNHATDPDLVDHAIYSIEAAERKYVYLLKRARHYGIKQQHLVCVEHFWPISE